MLPTALVLALAAVGQGPADWYEPFPAHKVIGNVYYVGSKDLATYLITTPEGHILINSGFDRTVPLIQRSVESLGFKMTDVKILLASHAHSDHVAGHARLQKLTGAKVYVMGGDDQVIASGGKGQYMYTTDRWDPCKVDRVLKDRDEVKLGGVTLVARLTPGHTRGCTTWAWKVEDGGKQYDVVVIGSPNVNPGFQLVNNKDYPEIADDYAKTFAVLKSLPCDVFLGAHGGYYGMVERHALLKKGQANPFVNPRGYKEYVALKERAFRKTLAAQQDKVQNVKRDIPYTEQGHERQVLDVYSPPKAKNLPVVFWIHGGGWQTGDKTSVQIKPKVFVDKGFVFVSTNYRLLPSVDMATIVRDIAKSIRWTHEHIAEYGGDPKRLFIMGHSAGAQLAALICTDDRYLKAEGLSFALLKGCVPVDGDTFDVPAIIETAETRWRVHGLPKAKFGHREKFGNDPAKHRDFSAVTHVAKDKGIPPFLILHVAEHPDTSAQARRLGNVLKEAGVLVTVFGAKETTHNKINADLGLPDDPATKALFEFLDKALKK
ncbi:MAG TPA: subclass B3 metallo-beta-lactamase [Gemmataceae bacterium]|jgi:acetyl esterase/lipase